MDYNFGTSWEFGKIQQTATKRRLIIIIINNFSQEYTANINYFLSKKSGTLKKKEVEFIKKNLFDLLIMAKIGINKQFITRNKLNVKITRNFFFKLFILII